MRKLILLWLTAFAAIVVSAQKKIMVQPGYGFINGKESNASQGSLDAYYRLKLFNIGLGAALDVHYLQSVPLYVATQKIIGKEKLRFVVYGNGGLNIPVPRDDQKIYDWRFFGTGAYKPGHYYDFGAGLAIMVTRTESLLLTCGFSGKGTRQVYTTGYGPAGRLPPGEEQKSTFSYNQQRIVVRLKLEL